MRIRLALSILMMVIATATKAQAEFEKNEVDEFTGDKLEVTKYDVLVQNFKLNAFLATTNINDSVYVVKLKLMLSSGKVHSIEEGATLYLKLNDGTIIELHNMKYVISCSGCGARGFAGSMAEGSQSMYKITGEQIDKLSKHEIIKFRLYTSVGYVENDVPTARQKILIDQLKLVMK